MRARQANQSTRQDAQEKMLQHWLESNSASIRLHNWLKFATLFKLTQWVCGALKSAGETSGSRCLSGEIKLPLLSLPSEPLLRGETSESRHFLSNTQSYNDFFPLLSFGSFVNHKVVIRASLRLYRSNAKFNQIGSLQSLYFMDNMKGRWKEQFSGFCSNYFVNTMHWFDCSKLRSITCQVVTTRSKKLNSILKIS